MDVVAEVTVEETVEVVVVAEVATRERRRSGCLSPR